MLTIYITHLSDDENGMVENDKRINVLNLNKLNSKPKKKIKANTRDKAEFLDISKDLIENVSRIHRL